MFSLFVCGVPHNKQGFEIAVIEGDKTIPSEFIQYIDRFDQATMFKGYTNVIHTIRHKQKIYLLIINYTSINPSDQKANRGAYISVGILTDEPQTLSHIIGYFCKFASIHGTLKSLRDSRNAFPVDFDLQKDLNETWPNYQYVGAVSHLAVEFLQKDTTSKIIFNDVLQNQKEFLLEDSAILYQVQKQEIQINKLNEKLNAQYSEKQKYIEENRQLSQENKRLLNEIKQLKNKSHGRVSTSNISLRTSASYTSPNKTKTGVKHQTLWQNYQNNNYKIVLMAIVFFMFVAIGIFLSYSLLYDETSDTNASNTVVKPFDKDTEIIDSPYQENQIVVQELSKTNIKSIREKNISENKKEEKNFAKKRIENNMKSNIQKNTKDKKSGVSTLEKLRELEENKNFLK
jgi:hypothetical protein